MGTTEAGMQMVAERHEPVMGRFRIETITPEHGAAIVNLTLYGNSGGKAPVTARMLPGRLQSWSLYRGGKVEECNVPCEK
jgi:hypothetical protein